MFIYICNIKIYRITNLGLPAASNLILFNLYAINIYILAAAAPPWLGLWRSLKKKVYVYILRCFETCYYCLCNNVL